MKIPSIFNPFPANEIVLRGSTGSVSFMIMLSGNIQVESIYNGSTVIDTYDTSYQASTLTIPCDSETDVIITGNVTRLDPQNDVEFYAMRDKYVVIASIGENVKTLDMRNFTSGGLPLIPTNNVGVIYTTAPNNQQHILCERVLNSTSVKRGGVLFVDTIGPHAADLITAARNKGWRVYGL